MPITQFLDGHHFDIETKRVMGLAFEMARRHFVLMMVETTPLTGRSPRR